MQGKAFHTGFDTDDFLFTFRSVMHKPEIYIHAGMGRAGSTFLQYRVFPRLKCIRYIPRNRFEKAQRIVARGKSGRYLVSGEFDPRFIDKYLAEFSELFPHARPILVIRRHDEWIASQYRRYLKNGNHWTFREFFDMEKDGGYWKQENLYYFPLIKLLEKYFTHKPLILLYDDLRKDPGAFVQSLACYMKAGIDLNRVDLSPKHASYNEKQLRTVYSLSGRINLRKKRPFRAKWKNVIANLGVNTLRYMILYAALLLPRKVFSTAPVFPSREQLDKIRNAYEQDWQKCLEYAGKTKGDLSRVRKAT